MNIEVYAKAQKTHTWSRFTIEPVAHGQSISDAKGPQQIGNAIR